MNWSINNNKMNLLFTTDIKKCIAFSFRKAIKEMYFQIYFFNANLIILLQTDEEKLLIRKYISSLVWEGVQSQQKIIFGGSKYKNNKFEMFQTIISLIYLMPQLFKLVQYIKLKS